VTDFLNACLFGADLLVTLAAAWLLVRGARVGSGWLAQLLAWGLAGLMLVVGAGEIAGWVGAFGPAGFLAAHLSALLLLVVWRKARMTEDVGALRELGGAVLGQIRAGGPAAWLGGLLLAVMAVQVWLAAAGWPVVFDALSYRLPRIALWLQDGRITHFATDDARLNYMPVAPDLVMAWLLGAHAGGYPWVALAQTFGGALLLGATAGLARGAGLGRAASLGAAAMILGLANVVPQFTSAYTDLFTAGVFSAAFYLWLEALRRGEASLLGGAGVALAFGSKGTMFYLAPGLLLVVVWLGWRQRAAGKVWRDSLVGAGLAALLFVLPGMGRNLRTYGSLFGPVDSMQSQHGSGFSPADNLAKLRLNLATALPHLLEPNAQPPGLQSAARQAAETLAARLPEADGYAFEGLDRRENLRKVLRLAEPDADVASCGVLIIGLCVGGGLAAMLRPRRAGAGLVFAGLTGTVMFVACLYALLQWHPYSFRFWVLVAPWMAVVAAWGLESLPRAPRLAAWALVGASTIAVGWNSSVHTYQAGWSAVARPDQALGFSVFVQTRGWLRTLEPAETELRVALPVNRPLAAFLRTVPERRVTLAKLSALPATAEAAVESFDGWLIVPVAQFVGHEGRVEKRTWLFSHDEESPFSLAAYRRLRP
jgi:hypothetical protein